MKTGIYITSNLGDNKTFSIPLKWLNRPFVPGNTWGLTFTVKADINTPDNQALFQKSGPNSGLGINVTGSNASVTMLRADTYREEDFPEEGDPAFQAASGTYYWDIKATTLVEDETAVRTVASGVLYLIPVVTQASGPTLPIYTVDAPALQGPPGAPGLGAPIISATPPESPANGQQWIQTSTNIFSFWSPSESSWIVPATNAVLAGAVTFGGDILTFGGEILTFAAV